MKLTLVVFLITIFPSLSLLHGQGNETEDEPLEAILPDRDWKNAALLYFNSASFEVNRIRAQGNPDKRMGFYADALEAIHSPGGTQEDLEKARETLSALAVGDANDDLTMAAKFYLIRIVHRHQAIPDPELAARLYRDLFLENPDHYFGQMALQMHAFIVLNLSVDELVIEETFAELERLGEDVSIPDPRRGFHRVLGEAYVFHGLSNRKAFEHLKIAFELGFPLSRTQVGPLLQLGELAENLGEKGYAIQLYSDFLSSPRNSLRRNEVEARLANLGAAVN
ncbi:MAG: hypothetical protein F6K21_25415 [Symploca sp. SIO2D2]|nr:hypothetical protein [Symploca sp. SIO2D2]